MSRLCFPCAAKSSKKANFSFQSTTRSEFVMFLSCAILQKKCCFLVSDQLVLVSWTAIWTCVVPLVSDQLPIWTAMSDNVQHQRASLDQLVGGRPPTGWCFRIRDQVTVISSLHMPPRSSVPRLRPASRGAKDALPSVRTSSWS